MFAILDESSRVFHWSLYTYPMLDKWSFHDRIVFIGDACHATTPFVGQGANQAIQDAYCLSLNLKKFVQNEQSLHDALINYEKVRKPVCEHMIKTSKMIGDL